jgi:5-methylcytosine-specific restriction endonuclease McrA
MGKRTPAVPCTPDNCGDLFPKCGKATTYHSGKCRCDSCRDAHRVAANRYREKNREAATAYQRQYYSNNRQNAAEYARNYRAANHQECLERDRRYYIENRENCLKRDRQYRSENSELIAAQARKWAKNNPDKRREAEQRRRARLRGNETFLITDRDWQRLISRHRYCCYYCGSKEALTMDHIIPITRDGRHSIGNLVPACKSCNSSKRTRTIMEWRLGRSVRRARVTSPAAAHDRPRMGENERR